MFQYLHVIWIVTVSLLFADNANGFTSSVSSFVAVPQKAAFNGRKQSPFGLLGAKKGPKEDLSAIETRDMTREEMLALNKKNEEVMNAELGLMTGFSLLISLPILYLCWVAFFSE